MGRKTLPPEVKAVIEGIERQTASILASIPPSAEAVKAPPPSAAERPARRPGRKKGPHKEKRLSAVSLAKLGPGMHLDGGGLFLAVSQSGSRSWILRTLVRGHRRDIGLGPLSLVPLVDARAEAVKLRLQARKGEDILGARRMEKRKSTAPTFEAAARLVHKDVAPTLKNEHNKTVWIRSLELHVFPEMGGIPVDKVEAADIIRAIRPIWLQSPDMARKTLARIRRVMEWATINKFRSVSAGGLTVPMPNPCDGVHKQLGKQPKDGTHAALAWADVPGMILDIRAMVSSAPAVRLAMEFTVLTCVRTSETLLAKWDEIDLDKAQWKIPAERMKMDNPHEVPLSARALEILREAAAIGGDYVFPAADLKEPLGNVTMLRALQRMEGREKLTMHGFRAAFKTWAHEQTKFDTLVIEASLAHQVTGLDRSYLRTTFPALRRKLMDAWSRFATTTAGKVVDMRARA